MYSFVTNFYMKIAKLIVLFCVLVFTCYYTKGQSSVELQVKANKYIAGLRAREVKLIGCYTYHCESSFTFPDKVYVFWRKDNKTFVRKIDGSDTLKAIVINDSLFRFYESNKNEMRGEKVRSFEVKNANDSLGNATVSTDHYCLINIKILDHDKKLENTINTFELREVSGNSININYKTNNNLKIVKWTLQMKKMFDKLQK